MMLWALGLAIVPFMLPNLSAACWATPAAITAFFSTGLYRQYLSPNETVIVLPDRILGEATLWQAATGMYFRMAECARAYGHYAISHINRGGSPPLPIHAVVDRPQRLRPKNSAASAK